MGHSPVLPAAWDHAVIVTHSRSSECSSRQPVEKALDHRHRVVSASQDNNKLVAFVSPVPDPQAVAVDAVLILWERWWVYAYHPTPLMQRVLSTSWFAQISVECF